MAGSAAARAGSIAELLKFSCCVWVEAVGGVGA